MLRTLLASFFLVLSTAGLAQSQSPDPFAILFGEDEETIDSGTDKAPGRDDIELVEVRLADFELIKTQTAFKTETGLCLPVPALFEALEVPGELSEDTFQGWFIRPDRALFVDFNQRVAQFGAHTANIQPTLTDDGWCLSLADLSSLLPIDFEYRPGVLSVVLTPREVLPIEARLERDALRKQISTTQTTQPDYPVIDMPYEWLSLPTADIGLDLQLAPEGGFETTGSIELAGDVLKMTGRLQYSGDGRPRLTLGRMSSKADQLGPLKARSFEIGDVVAARLPLLSESGLAQGITVSNRPTVSASVFDVTDIRGPLPNGWEAELYDGEQLMSFVTEADENGDYVFSDVILRPGYNRLTVKLFGPYGEREDRVVKIMVGSELCPENELQYSFGFVSSEGVVEDGASDSAVPSAYASVRYGLSNHASAQIDGIVSAEDGVIGLGASLSGSALDTYGVLRIASDGAGRPALSAALQKRLNDRGGQLKFNLSDFGGMETPVTGFGDQRMVRSALLTYDTSLDLGIGRGLSALRTRMEWAQFQDQRKEFHASARLAGAYGATRWSHALRYSRRASGAGGADTDILGDVLLSRSFKGLRVRGAMTYSLQDGLDVKTLALAAQKRFGRKGFGQVAISRDMESSAYSLNASYSKAFDRFVLSANAGTDQDGAVTAGLRLSFSLFNDPSRGRYAMASPGLSRSGAVRAFVYDDLDDDGRFDEGDIAIPGTGFIVDQSLRAEQTDENGGAVLGDLQSGYQANIELKQSTLDDPYLKPTQTGFSVTPRPGRIVDVAFPLTATGDVDGTVKLQKGAHETPVSGVLIEAVDEAGQVLATATSEYDGYFYIDDIPARPVTLKVAEMELEAIEAQANPVQVSLSRDAPSVMGVALLITDK